jgi:hypothetical protein
MFPQLVEIRFSAATVWILGLGIITKGDFHRGQMMYSGFRWGFGSEWLPHVSIGKEKGAELTSEAAKGMRGVRWAERINYQVFREKPASFWYLRLWSNRLRKGPSSSGRKRTTCSNDSRASRCRCLMTKTKPPPALGIQTGDVKAR